MAGLLDDSGSESDAGGVTLTNGDSLKVNEEYARRFDYNKKREELRRLEDKYGSSSKKRKRVGDYQSDNATDESTSESETEDEGELATEALDFEIIATLNAIKSKDPRVYDTTATFYTEADENSQAASQTRNQKEKAVYLRDYHRQNILNGVTAGGIVENESAPKSYVQEQADLKASIVKEIQDATGAGEDAEDEEDPESDTGFLRAKEKSSKERIIKKPKLDVENADKDPETFLSNFMSSRAWAANERSHLQPFESDDEEEEKRAEEFEEAYNFRFEDPQKSNEKLLSHARDVASKYSVRRDEKSTRQKKRDLEKERKEQAKQELQEDKARLRKLRIEEMEEKVRRIKRAAGMSNRVLDDKAWAKFLENDWDDSNWDQEMQKHFDDEYYAAQDMASDAEGAGSEKKKKLRKPKWDDDIEIKDLVPDFEEDEQADFSLSDGDQEADGYASSAAKSSKQRKQERADRKRASRIERQKIEQMVDDQLKLEAPFLTNSQKEAAMFRYRETSPTNYGLTARDILMADDSQLNQFAGLKKLAAFRDPEKKMRDQKKLGKKARLRQWRKDTFGDENGPREEDISKAVAATTPHDAQDDEEEGGVDIRGEEGGKRKKKRRSKKKKISMET